MPVETGAARGFRPRRRPGRRRPDALDAHGPAGRGRGAAGPEAVVGVTRTARAAAHSEEACLLHVTDGAIKSMLRSAATDQGGLEVLSIAGARGKPRAASPTRCATTPR